MAIQSEKFGFEVKDNTTGLPLSGATVELREGSNVYTLTELGTSAYYVIASIPTGKYDVYVNSVATGQSFGVGVGQIAALGNTSNNVPVSTASAYDFQDPTELKTTLNLENVTNVAVPVPSVSDANKVIQVDSNGDYELATVSAAGFNTVFEVTKASELIAALSAEFREKTIIMSEGSFFFNSSQTFEVYGACNIYAGDGLQGVIFGNNVGQTITFNAAAGTTPNVGLYFYTSKLQFDSSLSGELTYVFNVPVYSRTLNFLDQINCFISGTGTIYYEKLNSSIPGGVSITVTEFVWDATASGSIPSSAQDGSFVLKNADGSILVTDNILAPSFRWDSANSRFLLDGTALEINNPLMLKGAGSGLWLGEADATRAGVLLDQTTEVLLNADNGRDLKLSSTDAKVIIQGANGAQITSGSGSINLQGLSEIQGTMNVVASSFLDATAGTLSVGTPTSGLHAANKNYVDNAVIGSVQYQGSWNAASNTPTLTSGAGTQGHYYIVSVEGTTNLDGITDWKVGDWAIFNGTTWDKIDNTDFVKSVTNIGGGAEVWAQVTGAGDAQFRTIANGSFISFSSPSSTINVDDSRVVSTDTAQTITGSKTFSSDLTINNDLLATSNNSQIVGGFGANTTVGVKSWDDVSNARSGSGEILLNTDATNGSLPHSNDLYHPFSFEYQSRDGSGNMTQFAIPYRTQIGKLNYRSRFGGVWQEWAEFLISKPNATERVYNFPTSTNSFPSNGDIWFDGTNLKGREGGATFNLNGAGGVTKLKYQSTTNIANISGGSALSGSYFATKIIPEADIDVDKFEYYVTSASTGKTVYCGIYSSDGATLLGEASGNTDAVGERITGSISGGPVSLTGGTTYWLSVLEGSGTPNLGSKTAFADANLNRSAFVSGSPTGMPTSITAGTATTTAFYIGVLA